MRYSVQPKIKKNNPVTATKTEVWLFWTKRTRVEKPGSLSQDPKPTSVKRQLCVHAWERGGIKLHRLSEGTVISRALVKNQSAELFNYSITLCHTAFRDAWRLRAERRGKGCVIPGTRARPDAVQLQELYFALLLVTERHLLAPHLRGLAPLRCTPTVVMNKTIGGWLFNLFRNKP